MTITQPRRPRGTPTGGQFAPKSQPESDLVVKPSWPGLDREVLHHGGMRSETWSLHLGRTQDPPDGSPAIKTFDQVGRLVIESHWTDGLLNDLPDGSPAVRHLYPDGSIKSESHWSEGSLQDPPDGSPAITHFWPDGSVESESHWVAGVRQPSSAGATC
jgi:hypothetical protein